MGICNDDCDCLVDGDRGILVTGTGEPDTPYIVSPDTARDLTLWVTTRSELPVLTVEETGTLAFAEDTGILWHWNGTGWRVQGTEWYRSDFTNLTINEAPADSPGFVCAGTSSFALWAKGWVDTEIPDATGVGFYLNLKRTDSGAVLDTVEVSARNDSGAPDRYRLPFSLLATLGLGSPTDVTGIVIEYYRDPGANSAELNNGRIFSQTITLIDTTLAI